MVLPFVLAVKRKKRMVHDIAGHGGSERLAVLARSSKVNAAEYPGVFDFLKSG